MVVLDDMYIRISRMDEDLMGHSNNREVSSPHSIYRLQHDLLHLRILFNPLAEMIFRLQRTRHSDESSPPTRRVDSKIRLGMKHRIVRRKQRIVRLNPSLVFSTCSTSTNSSSARSLKTSIFLHDELFVYLSGMSSHVKQVMDTLEIHRESASALVKFSVALKNDETQQTLKLLLLISALFMPCMLFTGINSLNFHVQPQRWYTNSYYIVLSILATIIISMLTLYKTKRWL